MQSHSKESAASPAKEQGERGGLWHHSQYLDCCGSWVRRCSRRFEDMIDSTDKHKGAVEAKGLNRGGEVRMDEMILFPALHSIFQNLSIVCTTYKVKPLVRHPRPPMVWPQLNSPSSLPTARLQCIQPHWSIYCLTNETRIQPLSGITFFTLCISKVLPVLQSPASKPCLPQGLPRTPTPAFPDRISLRST